MSTPLLVGLIGRSRAGKDTVGRILCGAHGSWSPISFAGPLKVICGDVFRFSTDQIHGDKKNDPDPRYQRADGSFLTPREAMQKCGTEFGRSCYPGIWTELCLHNAKGFLGRGENVVITDCRFKNEAVAIKSAGGLLWRIVRPSADDVPATHPSETEMDRPEMAKLVDRVIWNGGTLEDLEGRVAEAIK